MRKLTIEQRIARLEKLLSGRKSVRNENIFYHPPKRPNDFGFRNGVHVVDADGEEGTIVDAGTLREVWKWNTQVANRDEVELWIDESDDDIWNAWTVVIKYDTGEYAGDHVMTVYPDESLEIYESVKRSSGRKSVRNEDMKRLPNGMTANRVCDVLGGWAGTGWARPANAIRELDRKGILDAAVNKWYPTADAVAKAIESCWNDQIGAIGEGAAQFFIGDIGGVTHCSLTLYPITGGDSRARNLVLKFNWPDDIM